MLRRGRAWFTLLTQMGPVARVGGRFEKIDRMLVLESLANTGFFQFLDEPRTLEEILDKFGFEESDYSRDVLEVLSNDKAGILRFDESGKFVRNKSTKIPSLRDMSVRDLEKLHGAIRIIQDFALRVPDRMRGENITYSRQFEEKGTTLFDFDEALTNRLYTALRNTAFSFGRMKELEGRDILDIGCGAGRETAELWLQLKGKSKIVAIDPVEGFVKYASDTFPSILTEIARERGSRGRAELLKDENFPSFSAGRAEDLSAFDDGSFGGVFYQQILHWTTDPRKAIHEIGRVLKPGGHIFGSQGTLPTQTPYMNLILRVNQGVVGFFSKENYNQWLKEAGISDYAEVTPAGVFWGTKKVS